jgi:hypothetical protein
MRIARFRSRTEAFITRRFWTSTRLAGRKLAGHARRLCVIALLGAVSPGWALDPDRFLTEYHRAVFTARDGAPQSVWSFAQGPDGLLWIGSGGGGIHRFDGHSFEPIPQLGDEDIRQRTPRAGCGSDTAVSAPATSTGTAATPASATNRAGAPPG